MFLPAHAPMSDPGAVLGAGQTADTPGAVLGAGELRRAAEDRALGIKQVLLHAGFDDLAPVAGDMFSEWPERAWQCPACQSYLAAGFVVCMYCKALPCFRKKPAKASFSPVAQIFLGPATSMAAAAAAAAIAAAEAATAAEG